MLRLFSRVNRYHFDKYTQHNINCACVLYTNDAEEAPVRYAVGIAPTYMYEKVLCLCAFAHITNYNEEHVLLRRNKLVSSGADEDEVPISNTLAADAIRAQPSATSLREGLHFESDGI
jgi:hypothetical protein